MINEVIIDSVEKALSIVSDCQLDSSMDRYRSTYLFRGVPNENFALVSSLKRNCKEKSLELEGSILRSFAKYGAGEDPYMENSVWRQMILGQHHGLPTRLLDWTFSPLIAFHYSTQIASLEKMGKHDAAIWRIDANEINSMLPEGYRKILQEENAKLFTVDMLEKAAATLADYDRDMGRESIVILEPPSIDQRIINQFSYFTPVPSEIGRLEDFFDEKTSGTVKYIIKAEIKWQIRDLLDQMNISERMLLPGLDGLSQWLKRHYYVK